MQAMRATYKWMQCLRSVATTTRYVCRSAHKVGTVHGSVFRHFGAKRARKAVEATMALQSNFGRSYAASVTPSESIEVDIMVEGSNQALDR